jgi:hypothetical protein
MKDMQQQIGGGGGGGGLRRGAEILGRAKTQNWGGTFPPKLMFLLSFRREYFSTFKVLLIP